MQTITLSTGQVSQIHEVGPGTRITSSGSGTVQWFAGSLPDAKNGGEFTDWPKGSAAGSADTLRRMCVRATATGSMTVTLSEGFGDEATDDKYWDSDVAVWNADRTTLVDPVTGENFLRGPMDDGVWMTCPSVFRLRITGTGTVTVDAKDSLGNITLAVASYTASGATDQIEFPYAGDNAVAIRATLTGTATAEVI